MDAGERRRIAPRTELTVRGIGERILRGSGDGYQAGLGGGGFLRH